MTTLRRRAAVALSLMALLVGLIGFAQRVPVGAAFRTGARPVGHSQMLFADTSSGPSSEGGILYGIDLPQRNVVWRTALPGPPNSMNSLTVPTDGHTGYVMVGGSGVDSTASLIPFTTSTGKLGRPIKVGLGGQMVITSSGRAAYVANSGDLFGLAAPAGTSITPVDLSRGRVGHPIELPWQPGGLALIDRGAQLLVSVIDKGAVATVSTKTGKVGALVRFPQPALGTIDTGGPLAVDARYGVAFVGNLGQDLTFPSPVINVINLRTMTAEQPVSLGYQTDSTLGLSVDRAGDIAFASGPRGVAPLNVFSRALGPCAENTSGATDVATSPQGQTVYAARAGSGNEVISMPYSGSPVSDVAELGGAIGGIAVGLR